MTSLILFLIFFSISILFIPNAFAESEVSPVNEKYVITKNVGWGPWWNDDISEVYVNILDSRTGDLQDTETKLFVVHVSDFTSISKGHASNAPSNLDGTIKVSSISESDGTVATETNDEKEEKTIVNLSQENLTKFKIVLDTEERDTVTYSGKIALKNKSVTVSIPVEVVIRHDVGELIVTALTGVGSGIGISVFIVKVYYGDGWIADRHKIASTVSSRKESIQKFRKVIFSDDKPWLSTALIAFAAVPASVIVNTGFVGNAWWDIAISFAIGILVITKLLKLKPAEN